MRSPSYWLDPRGRATYGIGICARCGAKLYLDQLSPDPNSPGLMVCDVDKDVLDPWRLPARQTEDITLPFYRPDVTLTDPGPPLPVRDILGLRLETETGQSIVDEHGNYIDVVIAPGPWDVP